MAGSPPTNVPSPVAAIPSPVPVRPPLVRPAGERVVAGVAAGMGQHLGVSPWWVRLVLLLLGPLAPGVYLFFVLAVPVSSPDVPVGRARLAPRIGHGQTSRWSRVELPLLLLALALVFPLTGTLAPDTAGVVAPLVVVLIGAAMAWTQASERLARRSLVRIGLGGLVVAIGLLALTMRGRSTADVLWGVVVAGVVLGGVALTLTPVVLRILRDLTAQRDATSRQAERADIAAHLHDSVLQTLALIRARADEPDVVARLARSQERDLRTWLYEDRPREGTSVAAVIRQLAGEVEDTYGAVIDVVTAGDTTPGPRTEPVCAAAREALVNAAVHGGGHVSLYLEADENTLQAWVRDRGPGFDPDTIPEDRRGVRDSILGRMDRAGGQATIRSPLPTGGTEVHLTQPLTGAS